MKMGGLLLAFFGFVGTCLVPSATSSFSFAFTFSTPVSITVEETVIVGRLSVSVAGAACNQIEAIGGDFGSRHCWITHC